MSQSAPTTIDALPAGTLLSHYAVTGLIGQGGFGVVYLARDTRTNRTVAIKEFLPTAIAGRIADGRVVPLSTEMANAYSYGLKGFLREANLLAEFAHPGLVAVHQAWEQNDTAYMAMQYYPGKTLREVRMRLTTRPAEAQIQAWMSPVFDAVAELHAHRVIHRDISPDNILVMAAGETVLLDLGAARQVLGGMTQALTTILKPGFAPIEQYVEDGSMEQGRWTDVYGLGAVIYFLVTGQPPTPATTRIVRDSMPSLASLAPQNMYSPAFAAAVAKALSLRAIDRFKSMAEFRTALGWVAQRKTQAAPTERTSQAVALSTDEVGALLAPPSAAENFAPKPASMAGLRGKGLDYQEAAPGSKGVKIVAAMGIALVALAGLVFFLK
jgi:non-specific serine/threonine protein kinase